MFLGDKKDGIPSLIFKMIRFLDYARSDITYVKLTIIGNRRYWESERSLAYCK